MDNVLELEAQTKDIGFKVQTREGNNAKFYVNCRGSPMGSQPVVKVNFAKLPQSGAEKIRGVNPIYIKKTKKTFKKIKLGITYETAPDVVDLCRSVLKAWERDYNPISRSMWYQKTFGFEDGTQVYGATIGITTPTAWTDMNIEGDQFNSPGQTFAPALYGTATDATWYIDSSIPEAYEDAKVATNPFLYLYDDNGKKIKTRNCEGKVIYPTGGIELKDNVKLKELVRSEFYTGMTFRARCCLSLTSLEWKCGTDTNSGKRVIYPCFNFRT